MTNLYPTFANLLGSYFHQDYDLYGPTVKDVVQEFVTTSYPEDINALRVDILSLLRLPDDGIDLRTMFKDDLQIDPILFSGSNRQFLQDVLAALEVQDV